MHPYYKTLKRGFSVLNIELMVRKLTCTMDECEPYNAGVIASHLSCAAMRELAQVELNALNESRQYMFENPACPRFNQLADRGTEYALQKTPDTSKKACIDKSPKYQDGPWTAAFTAQGLVGPMGFDASTRAKTRMQ